MALALDLLLGLVYGGAEAVVDLLVDTVPGLVPDQVGDAVDGSLQILAGLPGVPAALPVLLPAEEAKADLRLVHGEGPDIQKLRQVGGEEGELIRLGQEDALRLRPLALEQDGEGLLGAQAPQVREEDIRPVQQRRFRRCAVHKAMCKGLQRRDLPDDCELLHGSPIR